MAPPTAATKERGARRMAATTATHPSPSPSSSSSNLLLWASSLSFTHPASGELLTVAISEPEELRAVRGAGGALPPPARAGK